MLSRVLSGLRLIVLASLVALVAAGPAAAARPACDRLAGPTLAANEQLRVFVVPRDRKAQRETAIAVCAVKSRRVSTLASGKRSVKLAKVAVSGSTASAVEWIYSTAGGHGSGVSYSYIHTIDVVSRRKAEAGVLTGLVVRELAVTADGAAAVVGAPFGRGVEASDDPEPATYVRTTGGVFMADGRQNSRPTWSQLDEGADTALAGLAFSGSTLVWQRDNLLKSSPLPQ